jgi:hypothetical protein
MNSTAVIVSASVRSFLSIFKGEGHHPVFKRLDAAVGNGHPVGIAGQVFQHVFRVLTGSRTSTIQGFSYSRAFNG